MLAKALMILTAGVILTLGILHLVYTFRGPKLTPRDPALEASMRQVSPVITKETTMWRVWVGLNASHSLGLILFGLVFGFLALAHPQILFHSNFLLAVGLVFLAGFLALGKLYFFSIPLAGIGVALACYVASIVVARL
jgi:hypothetical protein